MNSDETESISEEDNEQCVTHIKVNTGGINSRNRVKSYTPEQKKDTFIQKWIKNVEKCYKENEMSKGRMKIVDENTFFKNEYFNACPTDRIKYRRRTPNETTIKSDFREINMKPFVRLKNKNEKNMKSHIIVSSVDPTTKEFGNIITPNKCYIHETNMMHPCQNNFNGVKNDVIPRRMTMQSYPNPAEQIVNRDAMYNMNVLNNTVYELNRNAPKPERRRSLINDFSYAKKKEDINDDKAIKLSLDIKTQNIDTDVNEIEDASVFNSEDKENIIEYRRKKKVNSINRTKSMPLKVNVDTPTFHKEKNNAKYSANEKHKLKQEKQNNPIKNHYSKNLNSSSISSGYTTSQSDEHNEERTNKNTFSFRSPDKITNKKKSISAIRTSDIKNTTNSNRGTRTNKQAEKYSCMPNKELAHHINSEMYKNNSEDEIRRKEKRNIINKSSSKHNAECLEEPLSEYFNTMDSNDKCGKINTTSEKYKKKIDSRNWNNEKSIKSSKKNKYNVNESGSEEMSEDIQRNESLLSLNKNHSMKIIKNKMDSFNNETISSITESTSNIQRRRCTSNYGAGDLNNKSHKVENKIPQNIPTASRRKKDDNFTPFQNKKKSYGSNSEKNYANNIVDENKMRGMKAKNVYNTQTHLDERKRTNSQRCVYTKAEKHANSIENKNRYQKSKREFDKINREIIEEKELPLKDVKKQLSNAFCLENEIPIDKKRGAPPYYDNTNLDTSCYSKMENNNDPYNYQISKQPDEVYGQHKLDYIDNVYNKKGENFRSESSRNIGKNTTSQKPYDNINTQNYVYSEDTDKKISFSHLKTIEIKNSMSNIASGCLSTKDNNENSINRNTTVRGSKASVHDAATPKDEKHFSTERGHMSKNVYARSNSCNYKCPNTNENLNDYEPTLNSHKVSDYTASKNARNMSFKIKDKHKKIEMKCLEDDNNDIYNKKNKEPIINQRYDQNFYCEDDREQEKKRTVSRSKFKNSTISKSFDEKFDNDANEEQNDRNTRYNSKILRSDNVAQNIKTNNSRSSSVEQENTFDEYNKENFNDDHTYSRDNLSSVGTKNIRKKNKFEHNNRAFSFNDDCDKGPENESLEEANNSNDNRMATMYKDNYEINDDNYVERIPSSLRNEDSTSEFVRNKKINACDYKIKSTHRMNETERTNCDSNPNLHTFYGNEKNFSRRKQEREYSYIENVNQSITSFPEEITYKKLNQNSSRNKSKNHLIYRDGDSRVSSKRNIDSKETIDSKLSKISNEKKPSSISKQCRSNITHGTNSLSKMKEKGDSYTDTESVANKSYGVRNSVFSHTDEKRNVGTYYTIDDNYDKLESSMNSINRYQIHAKRQSFSKSSDASYDVESTNSINKGNNDSLYGHHNDIKNKNEKNYKSYYSGSQNNFSRERVNNIKSGKNRRLSHISKREEINHHDSEEIIYKNRNAVKLGSIKQIKDIDENSSDKATCYNNRRNNSTASKANRKKSLHNDECVEEVFQIKNIKATSDDYDKESELYENSFSTEKREDDIESRCSRRAKSTREVERNKTKSYTSSKNTERSNLQSSKSFSNESIYKNRLSKKNIIESNKKMIENNSSFSNVSNQNLKFKKNISLKSDYDIDKNSDAPYTNRQSHRRGISKTHLSISEIHKKNSSRKKNRSEESCNDKGNYSDDELLFYKDHSTENFKTNSRKMLKAASINSQIHSFDDYDEKKDKKKIYESKKRLEINRSTNFNSRDFQETEERRDIKFPKELSRSNHRNRAMSINRNDRKKDDNDYDNCSEKCSKNSVYNNSYESDKRSKMNSSSMIDMYLSSGREKDKKKELNSSRKSGFKGSYENSKEQLLILDINENITNERCDTRNQNVKKNSSLTNVQNQRQDSCVYDKHKSIIALEDENKQNFKIIDEQNLNNGNKRSLLNISKSSINTKKKKGHRSRSSMYNVEIENSTKYLNKQLEDATTEKSESRIKIRQLCESTTNEQIKKLSTESIENKSDLNDIMSMDNVNNQETSFNYENNQSIVMNDTVIEPKNHNAFSDAQIHGKNLYLKSTRSLDAIYNASENSAEYLKKSSLDMLNDDLNLSDNTPNFKEIAIDYMSHSSNQTGDSESLAHMTNQNSSDLSISKIVTNNNSNVSNTDNALLNKNENVKKCSMINNLAKPGDMQTANPMNFNIYSNTQVKFSGEGAGNNGPTGENGNAAKNTRPQIHASIENNQSHIYNLSDNSKNKQGYFYSNETNSLCNINYQQPYGNSYNSVPSPLIVNYGTDNYFNPVYPNVLNNHMKIHKANEMRRPSTNYADVNNGNAIMTKPPFMENKMNTSNSLLMNNNLSDQNNILQTGNITTPNPQCGNIINQGNNVNRINSAVITHEMINNGSVYFPAQNGYGNENNTYMGNTMGPNSNRITYFSPINGPQNALNYNINNNNSTNFHNPNVNFPNTPNARNSFMANNANDISYQNTGCNKYN